MPNVLYSRGSVLTVWEQQLKDGQPLTLTEPGMPQFIITMGQAVRLIETAPDTMEGGEIFAGRLRGLPTSSFDGLLPVLHIPVLRPVVMVEEPGLVLPLECPARIVLRRRLDLVLTETNVDLRVRPARRIDPRGRKHYLLAGPPVARIHHQAGALSDPA